MKSFFEFCQLLKQEQAGVPPVGNVTPPYGTTLAGPTPPKPPAGPTPPKPPAGPTTPSGDSFIISRDAAKELQDMARKNPALAGEIRAILARRVVRNDTPATEVR